MKGSLALVPSPSTSLFVGNPAVTSPQIVLPNPEDQKQASERLAVLQPLLDFGSDPRLFDALRLADGRKVDSQRRMVEWLAQQHKVSSRTIWTWKKLYLDGGFPALADSARNDKGRSRWFEDHHDAAILAAFLYLDQRQSIAAVHEELCRSAEQLGLGADRPSYETVRLFLGREISAAMKTLAREGRKVYRDLVAPYLKSAGSDTFANQVWVGDHAIHDVEVANDLFDEQPLGAPIRLRLSAMLDHRSRKLVGASWAWEGSSRSIAATMRRGILRYGPPEHIYVDNGKDFKKVAKGARRGCEPEGWWRAEWDAIEKTGFMARLGIAVTHCLPRHPQSKKVERFFRTLHERFDALHSTYTAGTPSRRPEQTELAMMRHRRLLKAGRVEESNHPAASRFIAGCLAWIEEYNRTPHDGEGMCGCSPDDVFEAARNPNQKPTPDAATLALLMAEYERRIVDACAVRLRGSRYMPGTEDRAGWAAMHDVSSGDTDILVAYDPADLDFAAALDLDGRFLAWLEREELARFAPGDEAAGQRIAQSMSTRRGLEKAARTTLQLISAKARENGAVSAEESLYSRLQLPASTSGVPEDRSTSSGWTGPVITHRKEETSSGSTPAQPMTPAQAARFVLEIDEK